MQSKQLIAFMNDNELSDKLQSGFKADVMFTVMDYLSQATFLSVHADLYTVGKLMDTSGTETSDSKNSVWR